MSDVRKVITQYPSALIDKIDRCAIELKINRSEFLREAAQEKIAAIERTRTIEAARRGIKNNLPLVVAKTQSFRRFL